MNEVGATGKGRWVPLVGYLFYVAVLSAGYYYNLTFVQLGIIDLGTRLAGLGAAHVSAVMAGFAPAALVAAVVTGRMMDRQGWSSDLVRRDKLAWRRRCKRSTSKG